MAVGEMGDVIPKVTRMRVLHREVELTGQPMAESHWTGKIESSAEALLEIS